MAEDKSRDKSKDEQPFLDDQNLDGWGDPFGEGAGAKQSPFAEEDGTSPFDRAPSDLFEATGPFGEDDQPRPFDAEAQRREEDDGMVALDEAAPLTGAATDPGYAPVTPRRQPMLATSRTEAAPSYLDEGGVFQEDVPLETSDDVTSVNNDQDEVASPAGGTPGIFDEDLDEMLQEIDTPPPPVADERDEVEEWASAPATPAEEKSSTVVEEPEPEPAPVPAPTAPVTMPEAPAAPLVAMDSDAFSVDEVADAPVPTPPPAPVRHRIDSLPLDAPPPEGPKTWANDFKVYQVESQKLARIGSWRKLAAMMGHVLNDAPFATRMTRTGLLLDLAQLYRDRLKDAKRAEETFAVLAEEDPASAEALEYLNNLYETRGDWGSVYDLYTRAVEASWDPNLRLEWTRVAAEIAEVRLGQIELAIQAWEHLWKLGDSEDVAARTLARYYRKAGRWADMASFLRVQTDRAGGPTQLVILRELAEVLLSGLRSPDSASDVLEQIVSHSPGDAIATLQLARVYAQRKEWGHVERLGKEAAAEEESETSLDLQHLVADALWDADKLDEAVVAYERILEVDPSNHHGLQRKREYFERTERHAELLDLLEHRADTASDDEERCKLLAEAAELAETQVDRPEKAAELWLSYTALAPDDIGGYQALQRLFEALENAAGVANALDGQLRLTKEHHQRVALLREMGDVYARRLDDDESAESCWKRILALDPTDLATREELTELHRRRGDFEALNSSLLRQIWITDDEERAERLCRMAAENLDENFEDPERSIEAWRRVLDFRPMDLQALEQLAKHYEKLENNRELIAVLEQQIRAVDNTERRISLALKVAELWEKESVPKAAAATYERVFTWEPTHQRAIDCLARIYGENDQRQRALGVLEHASAHLDAARQLELARTGLELLPSSAHRARFFQLKRVLHLSGGDTEVLAELARAADAANLWDEQAAVLLQAISEAEEDARAPLIDELATIYEEELSAPDRAFLLKQSVLLAPEERAEVMEDLSRLAEKTKRHEDLNAFFDRLTTAEFELAERKRVLAQRAEICEAKLDAPLRAFHEHRRRLELDPEDWSPIADLERLAKSHNLWGELDAALAMLSDRCESSDQRMELLARREAIAREQLKDLASAFEFLIRRYRIDSNDLEILKALTEDAQDLDGWDWLLPVLEAAQLAPVEDASAEELMISAAFYEEKLEEHERAFALYREVFVMQPDNDEVLTKLEQLADAAKRHEQLADALRMAAATASTPEQTVRLLRKIATIYEQALETPDRAIDIHRRLLELRTDEVSSLRVIIAWHRNRGEWRDLRDRLRQWVSLSEERDDKIEKLLEIASISQKNLEDPEEALQAYGDILELDEGHAKAKEGLDGLVSSINEPALRKRWLMMQLEDANEARAVELRLEIARILEHDLDDAAGAIAVLEELVEKGGATGPGFEPISRLLREHNRWESLVRLLQRRAGELEDKEAQLETLDEALAICQRQMGESNQALLEELYRAILALRPKDREVRTLLLAQLRESGRFEELCEALEADLRHQGAAEKTAIRFEIARLRKHNLDDAETAQAIYERILEENPEDEGAILALAELARLREDHEGYIALRERQAKLLPTTEGALVLCHLAEYCDEHEALENRKVRFYRAARTVDPENIPAMEALKGIGRRLKNLRPMAALLPLEGEREIALDERAARLRALGQQAAHDSPLIAVDWFRRATAVAPFDPDCWRALAEGLLAVRDPAGAYRARTLWLRAQMQRSAFDTDRLQDEAQQLYELAKAAQRAALPQDHAMWVQRAFELVPTFAPAALAAAVAQLEQGDDEAARSLFDTVIEQHSGTLNDEQRTEAHFGRGMARRRLDDHARAMDDLRAALRISPLHGDALVAMGEMLAGAGRYAGALEHLIRALVVMDTPEGRARLHHRIGVLWEDGLDRLQEAGACYELAVAEGLDDRDLLHRALRHYKRSGRLDESLDVVEGLLPTAEESSELATLWLMRGEILASREDAQEGSVEAFDMALSYDPSCQQARDGLISVLEQRGDWQQLLQVLEASADAGPPAQRAEALMRLARVAIDQLGDFDQAEQYLQRSIDVYPTRDALQELERLCGDDPARMGDRRDILGLLVAFGPPFFDRCLELGRMLLDENQQWAWCLLSPLLGVSQIDQDIKSVVQGMRKEFERTDIRCAAGLYDEIMHADSSRELAEVLAELEEALTDIGLRDIDSVSGCVTVGTNTSLGKTFAALGAATQLPNATLHRTQTLPSSVMIVNDPEGPRVLVRTDVMQQLVHAEVGFLFAYALELAQPGHRLFASLESDEERGELLAGLWQALGFKANETGRAAELAAKIKGLVDEPTLERWADTLENFRSELPREFAARWWEATLATARRAGVLAGPDMRQIFRVVARMEESVPRPRVVSRISELDDYVDEAKIFADLLGFAASPAFGKLLRDAEVIYVD